MEIRDYEEKEMTNWGPSASSREWAVSSVFPTLMRKVYVWMSLALVITAVAAYGVASSPVLLNLIYSSRVVFFGLIIAELVLVFWISARIQRLSLTTATLLFILYSLVNGITLASIFIVYSQAIIVKTFLITAGTFAAMAAYGYFTKSDLTSWGKLLFMAVIGLIIAGVVNIFLKSPMMDFVISCIGVMVFVGLVAYDAQKIKQMLLMQEDLSEGSQKVALMGALSLYLDFINLFLYLLRLFGRER